MRLKDYQEKVLKELKEYLSALAYAKKEFEEQMMAEAEENPNQKK